MITTKNVYTTCFFPTPRWWMLQWKQMVLLERDHPIRRQCSRGAWLPEWEHHQTHSNDPDHREIDSNELLGFYETDPRWMGAMRCICEEHNYLKCQEPPWVWNQIDANSCRSMECTHHYIWCCLWHWSPECWKCPVIHYTHRWHRHNHIFRRPQRSLGKSNWAREQNWWFGVPHHHPGVNAQGMVNIHQHIVWTEDICGCYSVTYHARRNDCMPSETNYSNHTSPRHDTPENDT